MKSSQLLATFLLLGFTLHAPARESSTPPVFRIKAELQDGSRIFGQCLEKELRFHSATLGDIRLEPSRISMIEALARTNLVKITTTSGDVLTVEPATTELRVHALVGDVRLPIQQIRSVRLTALGKPGRPMDGLIGLWQAEGNANDAAGENSGSLKNVSFVRGVDGQAFSFAPDIFPLGTYTGVQIPDREAYELTEAMTIEGWVRPRGNGYIIMCRGDHRPGMDPFTLSMQANHTLNFQLCNDQNTPAVVSTELPYGRWTHVAATFDRSVGKMCLFTNGQLAAELSTSIRPIGKLIPELSPGLGIGNLNDGGNNFPFTGDIDEISLYNRALQPEEVQSLYQENAVKADETADLFPPRNPNPFQNLNGPIRLPRAQRLEAPDPVN